MHRCMLTHVMWKFEIDMSEVFIHNQSLLQLTFSSSSIIASFSARVDLAHFSWMAFGTWQRPDGFSSHSLLRRFSFAPSVWGMGRSAGGWTSFTATVSFSVCFVLVAGVPAGEGAGIFGVGVAVELLDRLLSARSFCISIIIALFASQRIKDTKGTKIENTKLKVNKYMISYQYDISVWHRWTVYIIRNHDMMMTSCNSRMSCFWSTSGGACLPFTRFAGAGLGDGSPGEAGASAFCRGGGAGFVLAAAAVLSVPRLDLVPFLFSWTSSSVAFSGLWWKLLIDRSDYLRTWNLICSNVTNDVGNFHWFLVWHVHSVEIWPSYWLSLISRRGLTSCSISLSLRDAERLMQRVWEGLLMSIIEV